MLDFFFFFSISSVDETMAGRCCVSQMYMVMSGMTPTYESTAKHEESQGKEAHRREYSQGGRRSTHKEEVLTRLGALTRSRKCSPGIPRMSAHKNVPLEMIRLGRALMPNYYPMGRNERRVRSPFIRSVAVAHHGARRLAGAKYIFRSH